MVELKRTHLLEEKTKPNLGNGASHQQLRDETRPKKGEEKLFKRIQDGVEGYFRSEVDLFRRKNPNKLSYNETLELDLKNYENYKDYVVQITRGTGDKPNYTLTLLKKDGNDLKTTGTIILDNKFRTKQFMVTEMKFEEGKRAVKLDDLSLVIEAMVRKYIDSTPESPKGLPRVN